MPLNCQVERSGEDGDALNSLNPVVTILYLFVVAFIAAAVLSGLH
jgi:hypothetical protein